MDNGWIKLHRKIIKNPVVMKDPDHLAVWIYLLLTATHEDYPTLYGGKLITLKPGQLVTGRKKIAAETKVEVHKVERILKLFKTTQLIEQQAKPYGSVISIVKWSEYQQNEQQNEQRVSNERATSEQRVSTIQEQKNKRTKEYIYGAECERIVSYLNEQTGSHYKPTSRKTRNMIQARMNEGFSVSDFLEVIDKKNKEWSGTPMARFLRPETLFGTKFEGYLNQVIIKEKPVSNQPEPPKYKLLEPEPEVETTQMPEELRKKYKATMGGLFKGVE